MTLEIKTKSGETLIISNFEKVNYVIQGNPREFTPDDFSNFFIHSSSTYNFSGDNKVSMLGSEIDFIEISQ